jgi:hypothetical protein
MYDKALSTYYALSLFMVGTAAFVMHPTADSTHSLWQQDVKQQFATAWIQVIGDQPWFADLELIIDGVDSFYQQSADATIALIASPEADQDIYYVLSEVYNRVAAAVKLENNSGLAINYEEVELPQVPSNFMQEEPLYNLIPYRTIVKTINDGAVAGAFVSVDVPANTKSMPWVTLKDNLTGQLYCLAVYNGAVNQYMGPCKYDYQ